MNGVLSDMNQLAVGAAGATAAVPSDDSAITHWVTMAEEITSALYDQSERLDGALAQITRPEESRPKDEAEEARRAESDSMFNEHASPLTARMRRLCQLLEGLAEVNRNRFNRIAI